MAVRDILLGSYTPDVYGEQSGWFMAHVSVKIKGSGAVLPVFMTIMGRIASELAARGGSCDLVIYWEPEITDVLMVRDEPQENDASEEDRRE
jgi:hypothetical protein